MAANLNALRYSKDEDDFIMRHYDSKNRTKGRMQSIIDSFQKQFHRELTRNAVIGRHHRIHNREEYKHLKDAPPKEESERGTPSLPVLKFMEDR